MKSTAYNHRGADKILGSFQLNEFPSEVTSLPHEMGEDCLSDSTGNPGTAPATSEVLSTGHEQVTIV